MLLREKPVLANNFCLAQRSSDYTIIQLFAGLSATLDRLRVDRQLEEALSHGPDRLHLAAVFGISHHTAMRYSEAARQVLHAGDAQA